MNFKKTLIIIGASLIVAFGLFVFPWFVLWFGLATMPNPPEPEITYGEFPFRLTYELNGETKIIEDTAIFEFDGYSERTEAGQSRKWKSNLKSGDEKMIPLEENDEGLEHITLLDTRRSNEINSFGNKVLELYFFGGNGHYYMDDKLGDHDREAQDFDEVGYVYQQEDGTIGHSIYKADEAREKYKIKIISWEVANPIKNNFSGSKE